MPKGPHSRRITVADNEISHCGRFTPEAVGVFVGDNANVAVIHNHIHDLFYSGISVGSVQDFGPCSAADNIVEYNHVHDIGRGILSDLAGIYTCSSPGTRIRYNLIHDVSRREYGGWGIYPDEGSHDLSIEKNLVFRCQDGALFAHHNRNITVENNIFAFNRVAQVDRGGTGGFELTCRRNIFYFNQGKAVGDYGSEHCGRDVCLFERNLYWNASGKPVIFGNKTFAEWQALGQDQNSLIADPMFLDPEKGDFTLRLTLPRQGSDSSLGNSELLARVSPCCDELRARVDASQMGDDSRHREQIPRSRTQTFRSTRPTFPPLAPSGRTCRGDLRRRAGRSTRERSE